MSKPKIPQSPLTTGSRVRFNGRVWTFEWTSKAMLRVGHGECEGPHVPNKKIRVRDDLRPFDALETLLHEGLHAEFWDLDEEAVHRGGHDLAVFAWRGLKALGLLKEDPREH